KNATLTRKKIYAVYGEDSVSERMCGKWFAKFPAGDFWHDNAPRSEQLIKVDDNQIKTQIENVPRYTTRIAKQF
ncbi:hypothetical protein X777_11887, partial [Ooceraea biroi]